MNKDVFGQRGDFITSPEICQVFGEVQLGLPHYLQKRLFHFVNTNTEYLLLQLLAVWVAVEYQTNYSPGTKIKLVELGPGRGTLAADMLRVSFNSLVRPGVPRQRHSDVTRICPLIIDIQTDETTRRQFVSPSH